MIDLGHALKHARATLLDPSSGDPLLLTPRDDVHISSLQIAGHRSGQVFQALVRERRTIGFLPRAQVASTEAIPPDDPFAALPPPDEEETGERDGWLQTRLAPGHLHGRLLRLHDEAGALYEERGVDVLHLTLGFLEWHERAEPEQSRFAPLILIPVLLERRSPRHGFRLSFADREILSNLRLIEQAKSEFGLVLPEAPECGELDPDRYLGAIESAVALQPRFRVHRNQIALGLFSLARFWMHRDLDPARWPPHAPLDQQPLLRALLAEGFQDEPDDRLDEARLDELVDPLDALHVVDADGMQSVAIEEVRRGRSLLIQGPPGTGKSQTIVNLIAGAVRAGRKVLFVAEKTAALEAVRHRLARCGLGALCLELHGRKASPRALLEELSRTLGLDRPQVQGGKALARELAEVRRTLNAHANLLHRRLEPSGLTPHTLIGHLIRLARKGAQRAGITLASARAWTGAEIDQRRTQIEALARCVGRMPAPASHPWRGVRATGLAPADLASIREWAERLVAALAALKASAGALQAGLGDAPGRDLGEVARLIETCEYLREAPQPIDKAALSNVCWREQRERIARLVETGATLELEERRLRQLLLPAAWTTDVEPLRRELARHRHSWLRPFRSSYRRARRDLQRLMQTPAPRTVDELQSLLDELQRSLRVRAELELDRELGAAAFGRFWRGAGSDWAHLCAIEQWQRAGEDPQLLPDAPQLLARIANREGTAEITASARQLLDRIERGCEALFASLDLDLVEAFGEPELAAVPLELLQARLETWLDRFDQLGGWLDFQFEVQTAEEHGLTPLVRGLCDGRLAPRGAVDAFELAVFEPLLREAARRFPDLGVFDGGPRERLVERFCALDRARIEAAPAEVALAYREGLRRRGGSQLEALERELAAGEPHPPIRRLLAESGSAVQAIKPVFVMSPLSVAEYLPPGALRFDLLVIDEASQVEVAHVLGAIARAGQMVVLGDDRQLPPRPFPAGAEEEGTASDLNPESILELCATRGMPQRALRWHYRSRHPALIAIPNRELYEGRLLAVPSPVPDDPQFGIGFHHLPDAVCEPDRHVNQIEATAVAAVVVDHARERPQLSLGVGCLSRAQRDAILFELERLRSGAPDLEAFFAGAGPERFFVKPFDALQGEERDVVVISLGVARDPAGGGAINFGPLDAAGGERRLNVLITRARRRLEVFASIRADDIDLGRAGGRGVATLKAFLQHAESCASGAAASLDHGFDSPFEEQVAQALEGLGCQVESQLGADGIVLDLAVRDPDRPRSYLLGIQCDGRAYRSARTARERDRLRHEVLEERGWAVGRVWSDEWLRRPEEELQRVAAAIERARAARAVHPGAARVGGGSARPEPKPEALPQRPLAPAARPYVEADFPLPDPGEAHLLPIEQMVEVVTRIVEIEGPIHRDEIARRLARLCGASRAGRRVLEAAGRGLARATRRKLVVREGDFYSLANAARPLPRDRSRVRAQSLRRPDMLPPAELRAAALHLAREPAGLTVPDAITRISRLLGLSPVSAPLRAAIQNVLDKLLSEGTLIRNEGGHLRERGRSAA